MGHSRHRVKRLEEISFEAAYKEILANLLLVARHRPEDRRNLNSYSSIVSLSSFFTSENVRAFIRNRLAQTLVGTISDETRKKFVDQFNQYVYDDSKTYPWVFYDVVLDENFTDLTVNLAAPDGLVDERIIPTTIIHSPFLSNLTLDFEALDRKSLAGKITPLFQSLNRLQNLTSLTLKHLDKTQNGSLAYLGQSVPCLKQLRFIEYRIDQDDLLNLLLGGNVSKLKELNINEDLYHQHQLPSSWITPFCSSLEILDLEVADEKKKLVDFTEFAALPPSVVACCIRHMPVLQEIYSSGSSVPTAVKMLYQSSLPQDEELPSGEPMKVDGECEASAIPDQNTPSISATGNLSLRSLDFVNIRDENMVRAVGTICPNLDRVIMVDIQVGMAMSPSELESYLSEHWPKIRHLTLSRVTREYRKTVIKVLGKNLLSLTLSGCDDVDPSEFLNCPQLETLKLVMSTKLLPSPQEIPAPTPVKTETFLPNLKTLETDVCLGEYSSLFQEKASLVNITIECCHTAKEISDWQPTRISKMWPRIQNFRVRRTNGLDMRSAEAVFAMFSHLKNLGLSHWMLYRKEERDKSHRLKEVFESKKIKLNFERPSTDAQCSVLVNETAWEPSEHGSECSEDRGAKFIDFEADIDINWDNDDYEDSYDDYDDWNESASDIDDYDDDESFNF